MKEEQSVRLNKYLAECGICSRREADRFIEAGKVRIDGKTAKVGSLVACDTVVEVNGKRVEVKSQKVVLAYYKPVGVTCTEKDAHAKVTITEALNYPTRVTYAGRLDKDSEGLMMMSDDGELIQRMMKAVNRHEKEYLVKVNKEIDNVFLQKMRDGIYLKELEVTTRMCKVEKLSGHTFKIILTQGYNRQIRRMCEALGYRVLQLKRIRIMNIELGNLKEGTYREITGKELATLYEEAGMNRKREQKIESGEQKRWKSKTSRQELKS